MDSGVSVADSAVVVSQEAGVAVAVAGAGRRPHDSLIVQVLTHRARIELAFTQVVRFAAQLVQEAAGHG